MCILPPRAAATRRYRFAAKSCTKPPTTIWRRARCASRFRMRRAKRSRSSITARSPTPSTRPRRRRRTVWCATACSSPIAWSSSVLPSTKIRTAPTRRRRRLEEAVDATRTVGRGRALGRRCRRRADRSRLRAGAAEPARAQGALDRTESLHRHGPQRADDLQHPRLSHLYPAVPVPVCLGTYQQRPAPLVSLCGDLGRAGGQLPALGGVDGADRVPGVRESGQIRGPRHAVLCLYPGLPLRHPHQADAVRHDPGSERRRTRRQSRLALSAARRARPEPLAAKLLDDHPSADHLLRVRVAGRAVLLRDCGAALERLRPVDAARHALRAALLRLARPRSLHGRLLGLRDARLARLLGLGPGRERLLLSLAGDHGAGAWTRRAEERGR